MKFGYFNNSDEFLYERYFFKNQHCLPFGAL